LWIWFGSHALAWVSAFLGFRLILAVALLFAGGARFFIGSLLLKEEKSGAVIRTG
jgi:hypothetical protein